MSSGMFSSLMEAARRQRVSFAARTEAIKARMRGNAAVAEDNLSLRFEQYPCFSLCGDCGHLEQEAKQCAVCGEKCVDLRDSTMARALQDAEEKERRRLPRLIAFLGVLNGLALFVLFAFLVLRFLVDFVGLFFFTLLPILLGIALFLGNEMRKPMAWLYHLLVSSPWEKPRRWTGTSQRRLVRAKKQPLRQGQAQAEKPLLSPLTQRPCLAYRIEAFLHDPLSMAFWVWMLDEKKSCSLELGDQTFEGESIVPFLETKALRRSDSPLNDEELQIFFRQRGLFWEDGDYSVLEGIIPVDADVCISELAPASEKRSSGQGTPRWILSSVRGVSPEVEPTA